MKRLIKISEHDIPNRDFAFLYINGKFYEESKHNKNIRQYYKEMKKKKKVNSYQ